MLFLYEMKSKHNAAFGNGSENECTIRHYSMLSLKLGMRVSQMRDQGRPEIVVDNEFLRTIVERYPSNTVRDYAELSISPTTISCHLKFIDKVK